MPGRPTPEGGHNRRHDRPTQAGLSEVVGGKAASNPWLGVEGLGNTGMTMVDNTKQLDA
jgi:hypothetical protein